MSKLIDMKDKHKNTIFFYCSIILIGGLIPFIFCFKNPLQTSLDIIRTISIMATSIFALVYFDPFGLRKNRKEKQYNNIIQLLEIIVGKGVDIVIEDKRPNRKLDVGFFPFSITKNNINKVISTKDNALKDDFDISEYLDQYISVDTKDFFSSQKPLVKLKNDIWTPKEISQKITIFDAGMLSTDKNTNKEVRVRFQWSFISLNEGNFSDCINGEHVTLRTIINQYKIIIESCEEWLKKHSFSTEDLNL